MKLKQKRLFISREVEFKEHGLMYKVYSIRNGSEIIIPYEDIQLSNLIRKQESNWPSLIVTPVLLVVFVVNLIALLTGESTEFTYGALSIVFMLMIASILSAYLGRRKEVLIPVVNRNYYLQQFIILFESSPDKATVDKFIEELKTHINSYLKDKYGILDKDFPVENQLQNFLWLKDRGAISTKEFEALKDQALGRTSENQQIGFKTR